MRGLLRNRVEQFAGTRLIRVALSAASLAVALSRTTNSSRSARFISIWNAPCDLCAAITQLTMI